MNSVLPVALAGAFLLGWSLWGQTFARAEWTALAIILAFVAGHVLRGLWH